MAYRMGYMFLVRTVTGNKVLVAGGFQGTPTFPTVEGASTAEHKLPATTRYYSQDAAASAGKSWNRQFQSSGEDTVTEVWGAPVGTAVPNSVYTLTGAELEAKRYEFTDTIGKGLRQRISDANRVAGAENGGGYSDDVAPDIGGGA